MSHIIPFLTNYVIPRSPLFLCFDFLGTSSYNATNKEIVQFSFSLYTLITTPLNAKCDLKQMDWEA